MRLTRSRYRQPRLDHTLPSAVIQWRPQQRAAVWDGNAPCEVYDYSSSRTDRESPRPFCLQWRYALPQSGPSSRVRHTILSSLIGSQLTGKSRWLCVPPVLEQTRLAFCGYCARVGRQFSPRQEAGVSCFQATQISPWGSLPFISSAQGKN